MQNHWGRVRMKTASFGIAVLVLALALGATAVCADDAERHGSKVMNAKAVSSDSVATCDLLHATQITARGG